MAQPFDISTFSEFAQEELLAKALELEQRGIETLKLYTPLPYQERFHACRARECLIQKGNQTGGSTAAFVEVARAVTNSDPYHKYPSKGTYVIVGYGERHIGNVIHHYLFDPMPNGLRVIRDRKSGKWRIYRGWDGVINGLEGDLDRESKAMPAPPLIPLRMQAHIAYADRGQHIFTRAEIGTDPKHPDWTILAYNSVGDPRNAQGFQANGVLFDEDIADEAWYTEMLARTMLPAARGDGLLRWNALPHGDNMALFKMAERAEKERTDPQPSTVCIRATIYDNPYIPEKTRNEQISKWKSQGEDVYRQRALGEFTLGNLLMYPTFDMDVHGITLRELGGSIPASWCRYMVVDPGATPASVLFAAVSSAHDTILPNTILLYDELQIWNCDAETLARGIFKKVQGQQFYEFVIDEHGSRAREIGSGISVERQYAAAFERHGIQSERTRHGFFKGTGDVRGRTESVRATLAGMNIDGLGIRVLRHALPNFENEMKSYRKKRGPNGEILDEPNVRGIHLPVTLEYLIAHRPRWARIKRLKNMTPVAKYIKSKRQRQMGSKGVVNL